MFGYLLYEFDFLIEGFDLVVIVVDVGLYEVGCLWFEFIDFL